MRVGVESVLAEVEVSEYEQLHSDSHRMNDTQRLNTASGRRAVSGLETGSRPSDARRRPRPTSRLTKRSQAAVIHFFTAGAWSHSRTMSTVDVAIGRRGLRRWLAGFLRRRRLACGSLRGLAAGNEGIPRMLALFEEQDVQTSWYVPGHTIETFRDEIEAVAAAGHELGVHGYSHENPTDLSRNRKTRSSRSRSIAHRGRHRVGAGRSPRQLVGVQREHAGAGRETRLPVR